MITEVPCLKKYENYQQKFIVMHQFQIKIFVFTNERPEIFKAAITSALLLRSVFRKLSNIYYDLKYFRKYSPLNILGKMLHHRCLIGS